MTSREAVLAPVTTGQARWVAGLATGLPSSIQLPRPAPVRHRPRPHRPVDLPRARPPRHRAGRRGPARPRSARLLLPVLVRPIVNDRFGLCRRLWSHASVPELTQIVLALVSGSVISSPSPYTLYAVVPAGRRRGSAVLLGPRVRLQPRPDRRHPLPAPRPERDGHARRRRRHDRQPHPRAALRRRPRRRDDGPLRHARAGRRRQAGRVPRRDPRQARQHGRRPARLRRPRPAR